MSLHDVNDLDRLASAVAQRLAGEPSAPPETAAGGVSADEIVEVLTEAVLERLARRSAPREPVAPPGSHADGPGAVRDDEVPIEQMEV